MFEGVPFITVVSMESAAHNEIEVQGKIITPKKVSAENMLFFNDCDFCMDGKIHSCRNLNVHDSGEDLIHVESIIYMEAGEHYYTRRRNLNSYLMKYTLEGTGELKYSGVTYEVGPGTGFLIDCTREHMYRTIEGPWKHVEIHIHGDYAKQICEAFLQMNQIVFKPDSEAEFYRQIEKILLAESAVSQYRNMVVSGYVNQLLMEILTSTKQYKAENRYVFSQLKYLVQYIENNYTEDLNLDYLAEFSSMSKYHMCRVFRKYMGTTINDYITKLRIERAAFLLRNSTLNANQIGYLVGFKDENYFYRVFKKQKGITPHAYSRAEI